MNHVTAHTRTQIHPIRQKTKSVALSVKHLGRAGDSTCRVPIPFPNLVAVPRPFDFRSMKSIVSTNLL